MTCQNFASIMSLSHPATVLIAVLSVDSNDEGSIKAKPKVMRTGGTVEIGELDIRFNSALYNVKIPQPGEVYSDAISLHADPLSLSQLLQLT